MWLGSAEERLLGVHEGALEAFYQKLDEELESKGLGWSGKGEQAISKAVALKAAGASSRCASL